jgi:glycogen(starch) synthase
MAPAAKGSLSVLQLGEGWFTERAGGLNRFYRDLLQHLPRTGVEVRGLTVGSVEVGRETGGRVEAFSTASAPLPLRWWRVRRAVSRALACDRFSLVASHFSLYTFPVLDLIGPRPLVIHFHGPWASEGKAEGTWRMNTSVKALLERLVYRHGTRFIVLSDAFRDVLHRSYRVPMDRIRVVPGGVEADRFATSVNRREARKQLDWPQSRPIVLTVRRLARRMGLENLIEAMNEVRKSAPETQLFVAGKGALVKTLTAQVHSLGLENNVRLLGFLPDEHLPLAYRAADLTVVPTVALEGFGLTTVESLAAGTPVLVTPVGGLPEVVSDLSPELVLSGTGTGPLAEGLIAVLTGGLTMPDAEACQLYARTHYAWPVIADRVRKVYVEALR